MTRDNSWRNGVMKKDGAEEGAVVPTEDIPMHETHVHANMGTDITGRVVPVAMKYTNSSSVVASSSNSTADATEASSINSTAAANTTASANTTAAANTTATVQVRSRNDTNATTADPSTVQSVSDYVEARTEAAWMKKELENSEAKAKYEALKAEIAINMTASNSWRNGVMTKAGEGESTATPAEEQKYDIPMHEVKPLAN